MVDQYTTLSLCPVLCLCLTVQYITARPGHNVILPCRAPEDVTVDALEWTRSDLEPEEYIFLVRDGIPDTTKQHPSFKNRVELMDSELKNGNLHLIVKNVTISDTGRYECRLKDGVARLWKRAAIKNEPVSIIELEVTDSGEFVPEQSQVKH